jgi:hypothetical protein
MMRDGGGADQLRPICTKVVRYLLIYGRDIFDGLGHQARSLDSIFMSVLSREKFLIPR